MTLTVNELNIFNKNTEHIVHRLIVIWALSEAALGGILHALRIPLTGIFINGASVILITSIAYFGNKRGQILKATLIVLLVKAAVSPHTPLTAYLAVSLQGIIGQLLFYTNSYFKIKSILFGVLTLFLSGIQRIIVMTIIFGKNLWNSIDLFGSYIINLFPFFKAESGEFEISYWLIFLYISMHILIGLLVGILTGNLPKRLSTLDNSFIIEPMSQTNSLTKIPLKSKKKNWIGKPSFIAILILVLCILILTYIYPQFSESAALRAITMLIRSVFIMILWYFVAGPFLLKIYKNYIKKTGSKYMQDVNSIIEILPVAKQIVNHCWNFSKKYKGFSRIKHFILATLINIIVIELPGDNEEYISTVRSN